MNVQQKTKGFTIIEVVLVLAIAGLIFLIVFLALPALQRSQRDTQRRSDVGRAIAAIQSYQSNNSGAVPKDFNGVGGVDPSTETNIIGSNYLGTFNDPTTQNSYTSVETLTTLTAANKTTIANSAGTGNIYAVAGRNCDNTAATGRIAVLVGLESGGSYCQTN